MARRRRNVPKGTHGGKFGLLLLALGIIGFAIESGYLNLPFWPTLLIVAGLWKLLLKGRY